MRGAAQDDIPPVPDDPQITEKQWYRFAVCGVIFTIVAGIFGAAWAFSGETPAEQLQRVQIFSPFGVALGAITTFCTVAWRGLVNSRQADQQKRQNDAKDEETLVKLLVDGTKLVTEPDQKLPNMRVGIISLQAVAVSPLNRFSKDAMDVLADLIAESYDRPAKYETYRGAREALWAGAAMGRSNNRTVWLAADEDHEWDAIRGAFHLIYEGGRFTSRPYRELERLHSIIFRKVTFEGCDILGSEGEACTFNGCHIAETRITVLRRNKMNLCDFSGAKFEVHPRGGPASDSIEGITQMLRSGRNFYYEDKPPAPCPYWDWSSVLIVKPVSERPAEYEF